MPRSFRWRSSRSAPGGPGGGLALARGQQSGRSWKSEIVVYDAAASERARVAVQGQVRKLLYGLDGATLYALLTGRSPFVYTSRKDLDVYAESIEKRPTALSQLRSEVPPALETITLKCLEKARELRYDTARELGEDLGRFLDGKPVVAKATTVGMRLRHWIWTRRRVIPAVLLVVVALCLVGELALYFVVRAKATQELRAKVEAEALEARKERRLRGKELREQFETGAGRGADGEERGGGVMDSPGAGRKRDVRRRAVA